MRGSVKWQAKEILKKIDGIGKSKRETRASSGMKSRESGHAVSPMIHSYQYYGEVLRTAIDLGKYAKENHGIKDMTKIDGQIVKDYLLHKMEQGVSYRTISNYASHLVKIGHGLRKIEPEVPDFSQAVEGARAYARENAARIERGPRFYAQPGKIVSGIRDPAARLVGKLQYELGLRVAEARHIKPDQIHRTESGYSLTVQGKGGYRITKELPRDLGHQLVSHIRENGKLDVKYEHYRDQLKESVERAGEEWHGTHGLRHSYAKERMEELTLKEGMSRDEALREVSEEMGHHRPDITEVYLR